MNVQTAVSAADQSRPMILVSVPDGSGGRRNVLQPAPVSKAKASTKRHVPDPINANPDVAAQQLRLLIERLEGLLEERDEINADFRAVMSEAKSNGYDRKAITRILKMRRVDPNIRAEDDAILETYQNALGIE